MDESVRHETEPESEQTLSLWGGSSLDIERSILEQSQISTAILGLKIATVAAITGDLGAGSLQEFKLELSGEEGQRGATMIIRGIALEVEVM
jgi:hypothetical protein